MELPEGSEYVALGSSYGAGPGLGDRVPGSKRLAGRSTHNYAHVLSQRLGLRLTDATFSGATIAQIIGKEPGATPVPQLHAVTESTRLVTLTGGGNDLGYIGYMVLASTRWPLSVLAGGKRKLAEYEDADALERNVLALEANLAALFDGIRSRAPRATIAITDYLTLLPPAGVAAPPLASAAADRGRVFHARVNSVLADAASKGGVIFADVSVASAQHHAWSSDPWIEKFTLIGGKAAAYHPLRAGMTHVADALQAAITAA